MCDHKAMLSVKIRTLLDTGKARFLDCAEHRRDCETIVCAECGEAIWMLSRKHYEEIAKIVKTESTLNTDGHAQTVLHGLAMQLCGYFSLDNPRFDRERFMKACGFS